MMTAMISKWGNSQGLRVSKEIMESLHLSVGDKVDVHVEDEKIIIKPIRDAKIKYDLSALVNLIPQNYTSQEEFSTSMGREEW
ncbi:AbrB/MazE/SpoVT family DNA-binding domain-containing protein [Sulfuricurvum sp.]|uniref:AbrB/MazE/SpoVT family DNA-binding domain-containing protein n=1 Tax=Sulfuricurvum sp. TaxID=2025608 RepID=UPI0026220B3B|nr:AbrB/MazE/SpoVT family DNA-binding domain-containing protein [Sulfuricurvum sp.]MDD2780013.1 AbrB/MazE/SpoVT family DNA-binding domain-containing protein [Sulfuricurvum sp.]